MTCTVITLCSSNSPVCFSYPITITVGWFAGYMCKNHNTWYTYLPKLLSDFYIIHICVCVIYKSVCGVHNTTWQTAHGSQTTAWTPSIYSITLV
jgi:hypothetical protein